jgi:hypothetical protein
MGTRQDWKNATVRARISVLLAIYFADEFSVASAMLGSQLCKTVNVNAILFNATYSVPNTNGSNIVPLLRSWLYYVFLRGFDIFF